jgi:hypothetical protein
MIKVFLNPVSICVLTTLTIASLVYAVVYRKKYHEQNIRMLDCTLCSSFIIKLLNDISFQSSRIHNFDNLLKNTKKFFQFKEISIHAVNANSITHIAGDSKLIEVTSHLEHNLPIVQSTIKHNLHYSSVLEDRNSQLYVIPISGIQTKMVLSAVSKKNSLTKLDLEILTKGVKYLIEICDALEQKLPIVTKASN